MAKISVQLRITSSVLSQVDELVRDGVAPERDALIEEAVLHLVARIRRERLDQVCAALDPREEKAIAEEGISIDGEAWPTY